MLAEHKSGFERQMRSPEICALTDPLCELWDASGVPSPDAGTDDQKKDETTEKNDEQTEKKNATSNRAEEKRETQEGAKHGNEEVESIEKAKELLLNKLYKRAKDELYKWFFGLATSEDVEKDLAALRATLAAKLGALGARQTRPKPSPSQAQTKPKSCPTRTQPGPN